MRTALDAFCARRMPGAVTAPAAVVFMKLRREKSSCMTREYNNGQSQIVVHAEAIHHYNGCKYIEMCYSTSMDPGQFLPLPQAMFHILVALAEGDLHGYAILLAVAARPR